MHHASWGVMFILFSLTQASTALSSDRQKPVDVTSDTAVMYQTTHTGIYRDHVVAIQGSTKLTADQVTAKLDAHNQLERLVALGTAAVPATFATIPHVNDQPVVAHAHQIEYTPGNHQVHLSGDAWVEHEKDTYRAQIIDYDTLTQGVQTPSGQAGATIVINPKS